MRSTGNVLRTRGPWIAAGIALLLFVPNLYWQARHGWPSLQFASSQNAKTADDTSRAVYVAEQILFLGAVVAVAAIGVVSLWRRGLRALAAIPILVTLAFLFERGRGYYPMPGDVVAVAAGAVAIESWSAARRRRIVVAAVAVLQLAALALVAPVVVPVFPAASDGEPRDLEEQLLQGRDRLAGADEPGRRRVGRPPAGRSRWTAASCA